LKASVDEENNKKNQEVIRDQIESIQRETIEIHGKELEKIKEDLRNQERHYKEQISKLNTEVQERESRIMSMSFEENEKLSKKDESISKFIKEIKDNEAKGKEYEKSNKVIENQNSILENEHKNLQTQFKTLETFNSNLGKENKILQDKIKNLQNELDHKGKVYTPEPKSGCMNSCVIY
jgi:chromosome segregation ATPase